ncbi:MAG: acetylglutamate kinase [Acidimicrobiaceae bacterium]|nr:acetylglutamate kinase [Acidimicrobiaceae bacterium]
MTRLVVKMGGHALDDLSATSPVLVALAEDLVALASEGVEIAVVHGGGPQIAGLLARVGLASEFHEGLRITSPETMGYVAMALSSVNRALVAALTHAGLSCVGLCGLDGAMIRGQSLGAPWDRAGAIVEVSTNILEAQWRGGYLPVVSSVIVDEKAELLNCNADLVAGALAGALGAGTLVLLSDIDQLRSDPDDVASALTHVSASRVREMIASGAARDGMRPKMTAALDALSAGAQRVVLANGLRLHAVRDVVHAQIPTTEVVA